MLYFKTKNSFECQNIKVIISKRLKHLNCKNDIVRVKSMHYVAIVDENGPLVEVTVSLNFFYSPGLSSRFIPSSGMEGRQAYSR